MNINEALSSKGKTSLTSLLEIAQKLPEEQQQRLVWIGEGFLLATKKDGE